MTTTVRVEAHVPDDHLVEVVILNQGHAQAPIVTRLNNGENRDFHVHGTQTVHVREFARTEVEARDLMEANNTDLNQLAQTDETVLQDVGQFYREISTPEAIERDGAKTFEVARNGRMTLERLDGHELVRDWITRRLLTNFAHDKFRELSGDPQLTDEQFIEALQGEGVREAITIILKQRNLGDASFTVTCESLPIDDAGWSWKVDVELSNGVHLVANAQYERGGESTPTLEAPAAE